MSDHERSNNRTNDDLPEAEQGDSARFAGAEESAGMVRRFPVSAGQRPPRLYVNNPIGGIRVRGGAAGDSAITLRATKSNGEVLPIDLIADVSFRHDNELSVKARPFAEVQRQVRRITKSLDFHRADFFNNLGEMIDTLAQMKTTGRNIGQVVLEVTVPPQCDVVATTSHSAIEIFGVTGEIELKSATGKIDGRRLGGKVAARTASGDITVDGVEGTAYLQSMSGEVAARGVDGDVVIHTTSGETRARDIVGQFGFKSMSGDLNVEQSRLNGFYINNTSGECAIEAVLEPGNYEVRTVSGEVRLRTQPDLSAVLTGRTVNGNFRCDLPYRYADDDWKSAIDDDERGMDSDDDGDDETEITLPGIRIGKNRVELPGIKIDERGVGVFGMRFDDEGIDMPGLGVRIGKDQWDKDRWDRRGDRDRHHRRERRRSPNRWEFLIGDPATATAGQTRLRIRTVSGSVTLRPGRGGEVGGGRREGEVIGGQRAGEFTGGRRTPDPVARPATGDQRGWPDSELWPHRIVAETGAVEAMPPMPPTPPTPPTPPMPPAPPAFDLEPPVAPDAPRIEASAADVATPDVILLPGPEPASAEEIAALASDASVAEEPATATAATATAEEPAVEAVPDGERTRLDILEALERREISADEALRLLRRLEI